MAGQPAWQPVVVRVGAAARDHRGCHRAGGVQLFALLPALAARRAHSGWRYRFVEIGGEESFAAEVNDQRTRSPLLRLVRRPDPELLPLALAEDAELDARLDALFGEQAMQI